MTATTNNFVSLCTKAFGARWTQVEVSKLLDCSQSHVSHLKHGKAQLSSPHARKLLNFIESGRAQQAQDEAVASVVKEKKETYEEMYNRIESTFVETAECIEMVADNVIPALLITGGPGTGKTFTTRDTLLSLGYKERKLQDIIVTSEEECDEDDDDDCVGVEEAIVEDDEFVVVSGAGSTTGLLKLLWWFREGGTVVVDDCDSLFGSLEALNLLKSALDSTDERHITYLKEASFLKANGIDTSFEFKGRIIIVSNLDIESMSESNHKLAPHFAALLDRCVPMNMGLYRRDEIMCRIEQISDRIFGDLTKSKKKDVLGFVRENKGNFSNFTIRLMTKIGRMTKRANWKRLVTRTMMRIN